MILNEANLFINKKLFLNMKPKRPLRPTTTSYSEPSNNEVNQDNGNVNEEQQKPSKEVNKITNPFGNQAKPRVNNLQQQKEENTVNQYTNPPTNKSQKPPQVTSLPPTQSEITNKINNNVSNNSRSDTRSELTDTSYDTRKNNNNNDVQQEQQQKEIKRGNAYTSSETSQTHSKIILYKITFRKKS